MSTIRTTLLVVLSVAAIALATATSHRQPGTGPVKLEGPSPISTSSTSLGTRRTIFYYTVTLNQAPLSNMTINLSDANGHISIPSTVTVSAGKLSANFAAIPVTAGSDTLTAYNGFSSASMDVTVTN